jgi:hypothetical protein
MHAGAAANTVIAFSFLLIIVYALTLAPVAWVYASEVWSLGTRAHGMALASLANWIFNFALGLFVPPAFRNITWKTFIVFGVLCMGAAAQAFVSYPETARKSLEEIEEMFRNGGPRPWHTKVGGSQLEARIAAVKAGQDKPTNGELPAANGAVHETVRRSVEEDKPLTEPHKSHGIEKV